MNSVSNSWKPRRFSETVSDMRQEVIENLVAKHIPEGSYPEQWDGAGLQEEVKKLLALDVPVVDWCQEEGIADQEIKERLVTESDKRMAAKIANYGEQVIRSAEKSLLLQILDHLWKEHLLQLDHLRQGIHLRGYGQRDPLNEYKKEAFALFDALLDKLRETVTQVLCQLEIRMQAPTPPPRATAVAARAPAMAMAGADGADDAPRPSDANFANVGRNQPCPCGSGRKFKHCHGRV